MLSDIKPFAIALGVGLGALSATVLALLLWLILAAVGAADAALAGLTLAVLMGLTLGGFAAGRAASVAHRFNGSISGLGMAGLVIVVARMGGSPAPTAQVLWLALLGVVLGGIGGFVAGRRDVRAT